MNFGEDFGIGFAVDIITLKPKKAGDLLKSIFRI